MQGLARFVGRVKARAGLHATDIGAAAEIQLELDALEAGASPRPRPVDAEAQAAREFADGECCGREPAGPRARRGVSASRIAMAPPPKPCPPSGARDAPRAGRRTRPRTDGAGAVTPRARCRGVERPTDASQGALADIRDDVDEQVLPIFLEEAAELYPQAGEQLRAWRRVPADLAGARQLRRTLHTFKGSARMAGAMRLGELAHLMESRLSTERCAGRRDAGAVRRARLGPRPDRLRARCVAQGQDERRVARARGIADGRGRGAASAPSAERRSAQRRPERKVRRRAASRAGGAVACRGRSGGGRDRRPRDAARARRHHRPARQRGRRGRDHARAHRRRAARAEGQPAGAHRQRHAAAHAGARDRDPGRVADPVAAVAGRAKATKASIRSSSTATRASRSSRARWPKASTTSSTVQQSLLKNLDDADAALLAQARLSRDIAAAALLDPHRAVRQPVGAAVPDPAAAPRRSSTSAPISRSAARRSSSTARCWKSSSARSST